MNKEETKQYFIDLYVEHIKQEDIPEWANWIATDGDGEVWVYQEEPVADVNQFCNESDNREAARLDLKVNIYESRCWVHSCLKLKELLPHYPSQQKEESVQDKIEFEAVSGDQSLFDLVGAKDDDLYIVRNAKMSGIYAANQELMDKHHYWQKDKVLASRKVKEKPYVPEVGHTYKLSGLFKGDFICVFIDDSGVIWSTCGGTMYHHIPDSLSFNTIKFIRVD